LDFSSQKINGNKKSNDTNKSKNNMAINMGINMDNGRKIIKRTLFMSVLSTIRKKDSYLNIFYSSLLKKKKQK
jgi:hypothetical protein